MFPECVAIHLAVRKHTREIGLHRGVEAEELLHGSRDEARVVPEPFKLIGMPEKGEDPVADKVHGRLVAGGEEQPKHV